MTSRNGYFPGKTKAKRSAIITPRTAQETQIAAMPRQSRAARQALAKTPPLRVGGDGLVEGADRISESGSNGIGTEVQTGFRGAHVLGGQGAHRGHVVDKQSVEPIDLGLQSRRSFFVEGLVRLCIFIGYILFCASVKDIKRVFMYHGAEHKTIACYEAGDPLTVENVRKYTRFHPRCGTSFMILVIIISIFLYAVLPWTSTGMRIVYKLCMFPLLVGISYEILKWAGRSDSVLSKIVSQPGLWMQRLTTFEPDDSMIEVAIAAVTPVLPEKQEEARW